MRKHIKPLLLTAALVAVVGLNDSFAPPPTGGGGPSGGGAGCWPPPCIPIDGGVGILLIAGVAVAGKKLLDARA